MRLIIVDFGFVGFFFPIDLYLCVVLFMEGSANVRIGFANHQGPFNIPNCIARHVKKGSNDGLKGTVQDQVTRS